MLIEKFKGLRNTTAVDRFKPGDLEVAQNVDIDDTERVQSRTGFVKRVAGATHSLWADNDICLFVQSSVLKSWNGAAATTVKQLTSNRFMSYDSAGGTVYYSNGVDSGRVVRGAWSCWGVTPPISQPSAAASVGSLPAGIYMYALTFVRADGHESGTHLAGSIELTAPGGIQFSGLEVSGNAEVNARFLYLSSPGGEVLYRAAVLDNVATSYLYSNGGTDTTVPLATMHAGPPPAGDIVEIYNGCAFVASGGVVRYSDPYALELFQRNSFLQFPGGVTLFASLNNGVFVSAGGRTWYLSGDDPAKMESAELDMGAAVPGTAAKSTRAVLAKPGIGTEADGSPEQACVFWLSDRGVCVGHDDGTAENLTEARYSPSVGQRGAGIVRAARGYLQYLAASQGTGATYSAAI